MIIADITYNSLYKIGAIGKNRTYKLVGHNPVGSSFNFEDYKNGDRLNIGGYNLGEAGVTFYKDL